MVIAMQTQRRGDWWDQPNSRRYAVYQVTCDLEPFGLGEGVYPQADDLPYLMVVDYVQRQGPSTWLVRLVAHDIDAPPTLYFHHLDQETNRCSWALQPKTSTPSHRS